MSVAGSRSRSRPLNRAVGTVNLSPYSAHSVAGVLKLYFREMPEPLMTFELYPDFLAIARTQRIARSLARLHTLTLAHGVVCHVRACASRTGQYEYGNARLSEELINCLRRLPEAHYPLAVYLLRFLKARRHSHHPGTLARSYAPVGTCEQPISFGLYVSGELRRSLHFNVRAGGLEILGAEQDGHRQPRNGVCAQRTSSTKRDSATDHGGHKLHQDRPAVVDRGMR